MLFSTAKPTGEFGGFVTARVGNFSLRQLQGAINISLVEDKVELRLAGDLQRRRGYQYNIYRNRHEGRVSRESGRASLMLQPADGVQSLTVFQYDYSGGSNVQLETWSANACGTPGVSSTAACLFSPALDSIIGVPGAYEIYRSLHPGTQPGGIPEQVQFQKALGPWRVNTFSPSIHRSRSWLVTNTTSFDINDDLTVKNVAGGTKARTFDDRDPIGTGSYFLQGQDSSQTINYGGPVTVFRQKRNQYSEELQLVGKAFDGSLSYIIGGYYGYVKDFFFTPVSFIELQPFIPKTLSFRDFTTVSKTTGLFAQATQDLSEIVGVEGLKFTGGFRYTWERVRQAQGPKSDVVVNNLANAPINPAVLVEKARFSNPSWTAGLDWQATPGLLLYVANRGSWRSGGFNGNGPARPLDAGQGGNLFRPETTYDVEVGAKYGGRLGGRPFRLNVALYNQRIKNVQRAVFATPPAALSVGGFATLNSLTLNVPKARVRGVEADIMFSPVNGVEIGGSLAYTDATYTKGTTRLFGTDVSFGPYGDTPKWTGTIYTQVTLPVPESVGKMTVRGDVYGQTGQYFSHFADTLSPDTRIPGYKLANFCLDWNVASTELTFSGFVKNAFNATNYSGGIALVPFGLNGVVAGEPRTYGLEATAKF